METEQAAGRRYILKIVILFALGWTMVFLNRTALYPILPVLQEDFGLSATKAGLIPSVYYFFYVLFQIPVGLLGDKIGLKRVLVLTYTSSVLGLLMVGLLAQNYALLLASMVLYGGGASGFHPMAFSITIKSVPLSRRGIALAVINSGSALGLILGLSFAGPLYLATEDWRLLFLLLAAPTLVLAGLFAWNVQSVNGGRQNTFSNPTRLLRDKNLLFIYLAGFCSLYAFSTVLVWGPTFFLTERALDFGVAGFFTAIIAVSGIPSGLVLARMSDRWGRKPLALSLMPLAALAIVGLILSHSIWVMVVLLIIYGASGKLAWEPIAVAWLGDHTTRSHSESMGTALALFGTIGVSSAIIAPAIGGWIRDVTGSLEGAFMVAALFLALGTLFSFVPAKQPAADQVVSADS